MTDVTRHECLDSREIIANTNWENLARLFEIRGKGSPSLPLEIVSEIKIKMFFLL